MDERKLALLDIRNVAQLHWSSEEAKRLRAELHQSTAQLAQLIQEAQDLRSKAHGLRHSDKTVVDTWEEI